MLVAYNTFNQKMSCATNTFTQKVLCRDSKLFNIVHQSHGVPAEAVTSVLWCYTT